MRSILCLCLASMATLTLGLNQAAAQTKAELVSTQVIWDRAPRNVAGDIIRLQDRWFVVCTESTDAYSQDDAIRVLVSNDAATWESAALIQSPTPKKGLYEPRLAISPGGQLAISAHGIVQRANSTEPPPMWGGTLQTLAWFSKDGSTWSKPEAIGQENVPFGRVVWNNDVALSYACGCICGNSQTVHFFASKDGKSFENRFEQTFSGFFPDDASIVFDGDTAYCLTARYNATIGNARQTGMLGVAKAPYDNWEWKDIEARISDPNVIRLSDRRIVAAVGLIDKQPRTSLCEFDLTTGKLTEMLELPAAGRNKHVGIAEHDGHLLVCYHVAREGKSQVHLAKVKLL